MSSSTDHGPSADIPSADETISENQHRVACAVQDAIGRPGSTGHFSVELRLDPLLTVGVFVRAPREFIDSELEGLLDRAQAELADEFHDRLANWLECSAAQAEPAR